MKSGRNRTLTESRLGILTLGVTVIWTLTFIGLLAYEIYHENTRTMDMAHHRARAMAARDMSWFTLLGRRFFPPRGTDSERGITSEPVLACVEKGEDCVCTIVSDSAGRNIRAVNISAMEAARRAQGEDPAMLVSTRPLDTWEDSVLALVPKGAHEFSELIETNGHSLLRYLSFTTDSTAGETRSHPGRWIMSIALPMDTLRSEMWTHIALHGAAYSTLWLVGMIALRGAHRRIARGLQERLLMEAALRDNEERFERIATTDHVGIWETDERANTTFVNLRMAKMLGYTIEEMLGSSLFDFIGAEERRQAEKNIERRKQLIEEQYEFRFTRKDGTKFSALISAKPILDDTGKFRGALAVITDIGDRKAMEDALKSSEERLRLLLESTEDVITMIDPEGRILYYSAPGSRYGVSAEQMIGNTLADLFPPEIVERQVANIRSVVASGEPLETGERISWRGDEIWFQTRLYPVRDASGRVIAVSSFSRNVTEQKRAEEKLREAEEHLEVERLRSRIAGDLHDDIGSTLSSTSIFGELLSKEITDAPPRASELLSRIAQNIREVQQGLHDIVWTINPGNDSLDNLLLRLQEHAAEVLEGRGIMLRSVLPDGEETIRLSMHVRRDVYLMVKEAIHNVVKHSNATKVSITAELDDGFLRLTIADNGDGFEPAFLVEGNGLRNMMRRAATAGGIMELNSRPGGGTTVVFRIPIA